MLKPGDRVDRFEVLGPLGQGGAGSSYLARDPATGERIVLKFPGPGVADDASGASRFQREAEIARRLHHPNIQGVARSAVDRDAPYLALEYVEGRSLRAWLESGQPPTIEQTVEIALQIARAMAYAHAHDVYHRDLKPENVIVLADGAVKVIDFGSARMAGLRRLTFRLRGETSGTPDYMAPEQVQGGRGDARTDVYALGVMLYELLAGRVPFEGDNPQAVMFQQINSEPPPPTRFNPSIPPALEAIVLRALQKRPADRYQSATDFARALAAFRDTGSAIAVPPRAHAGWPARVAQRLRRS